jgi:HAE1 family hydrophobic/amphiphilic exporter-1
MNLTEQSVNRPVTTLIIYGIVVIMALFLLPSLPVDLFPEIEPPVLVVSTTYTGMGPETVEKNVTEIMEKQLSNLKGLENMTSQSRKGTSLIILEFDFSRDLEEAKSDIRDILNQTDRFLPDDSEAPVIWQYDISSQPILQLGVEGDIPLETLRDLAEDVIQPRIERIDGVAKADVSGGPEPVIRADISLNRLEAHNLTISGTAAALSGQNIQMSGGEIVTDSLKYQIRTDGEFDSLEEIRGTVIAVATDGTPVHLSDIADVYMGTEEDLSLVYINGNPGVFLSVIKESGANSIQVADNVRKAMTGIQGDIPAGVTLRFLSDDTTMIRSTMNSVYSSALMGAVLAMLILFLFLRSFKSTLVIGLSIPISLLVTFISMYFMGLTLNIMTMTGLVLGIGMMVDSSIVILENITRYRERGVKLTVAALTGSKEMMTSLLGSTLTTLCVFVPMLIWKDRLGMIGEVFEDMIITIVISLVSSLAVALTLVPVLGSRYLKINTTTQRQYKNRILRAIDNNLETALKRLETLYTKALAFSLRNRALVLTLAGVLFFLSAALFSTLGMSFAPQSSSDEQVRIELSMPVGTTLEKTDAVLKQMMEIIEKEITGFDSIVLTAGSGDDTAAGSITVVLPPLGNQTQSAGDIKTILRKHSDDIEGAVWTFSSGRQMGGGSPIDITIRTDDTDAAEKTSREIISLLKRKVPQVLDPSSSLDEGSPEYRVVIDRERASVLGLSVNGIATVIYQSVNGTTATVFRKNGEETEVRLRLRESDRDSALTLESLYMINASGTRIPLSNVARLEPSFAPKTIEREDETRVVHITGSLADGTPLSAVQPLVERVIAAELTVPGGMQVSVGGEMEDFNKYGKELIIVLLASLILVFGVMAAQFESLKDPFIIFFTIPLLLVGVAAVYLITGEPFSLFSGVGIIALVGIVVNNGIILVDYTNLLRKRGQSITDACIEGGRSRLRPILMTSLTTILGVVPMAFFPGQGTELVRPLGQTLAGGLLASMVMTLFVVPLIWSLLNQNRKNKETAE